jgi:ankyrin repeat protein
MNIELLTKLSEKRLVNTNSPEVSEAKSILLTAIDEIASLENREAKLAKLNESYGFLKNSLLHLAAKFGDELSTAKILDILAESVDEEEMIKIVNLRNNNLFTPMHFAAHSGNALVAEALIAGGAEHSPQASAENRLWTPIHYAAQFGHADVIGVLIGSGADKEIKTGFGLTPLVVGAEFGKVEVVNLMIKLGANINAQTIEDNHRMNALHYAAVGNFKDVAIALLNAKINRNQETSSGMSALDLAIQSDHSEMVSLLLSWGIGDLDNALKLANATKSIASLQKIKNYIEIRKNFFDAKWLNSYSSELLNSLKKCNAENAGSINLSPDSGISFNLYGILALKRQVGLLSKKDETFMQFCINNKMIDLIAALRAVDNTILNR